MTALIRLLTRFLLAATLLLLFFHPPQKAAEKSFPDAKPRTE